MTPLALTLISATLLFRTWAVARGWFFADDLVFLSDVARGQADPGWFVQRYNVHFMPLGFLLVLPVAAAGPFNWPIAATEIIVAQALSALSCWWMLRTLFGHRLRILVPLTFYLFSAISVPSIMWWAASLNLVTVQTPLFLGVAAHVTYLRTGRKRFALLATLCLLIALGFYVKAVLLPVVLAILTLTYFTSGRPLARLVDALRRGWFAWVLYALVGTGFLAMYFSLGGTPAKGGGNVDLAELAQRQIVGSLGSGLLGGPWTWTAADIENGPRQLADPSQLVQITCAVVLLLLVIYLAGRYHGALRPFWFVIPCLAFTVGLLGAGRAGVFGTAISMEVRYWSDCLPYFTLALGLMTMPLPGAAQQLRLRTDPIIARRLPRRVVVGLGAAYVIGAVVSTTTYVSTWHDNYDTRAFLHTATESLEAQPVRVDLADEAVPQSVMQSLTFPYNLTGQLLAPLDDLYRTPSIANDIHVLDGFGQVVLGEATPDLRVPAAELTKCLVGDVIGAPAVVDLGSSTFDFPFWASVTYRSATSFSSTVTAGSGTYDITLLDGLHTLSFRTTGTYDTLAFDLPSGARMCIDRINIGQRIVGR